MAGRARHKAMVAELEQRAVDADVTVHEYIVEWVESGKTLLSLAEEITSVVGMDISRSMVNRYANEVAGQAALKQARLDGAGALVDDAIKIVDDEGNTSREEIARAKVRADLRLSIAGKWNREEYGEQKQPLVQVNVGQLHADAMRRRTIAAQVEAPALPAGPDFETVPSSGDQAEGSA